MASEAEGFGLPLIEASKHKLPIIARDIPVFKEITKDSAFYFNNDLTENTIFTAVKDWLMLYKSNQHPKSENIHFMNWEQHTDKLADIFVTHQPSKITVDLKKTEDSNV